MEAALKPVEAPFACVNRPKPRHRGAKHDERVMLERLERVMKHAVSVMEDEKLALAWMDRPNWSLGGVIPRDLLATEEGTQEVDDILGRIEYGVFG